MLFKKNDLTSVLTTVKHAQLHLYLVVVYVYALNILNCMLHYWRNRYFFNWV